MHLLKLKKIKLNPENYNLKIKKIKIYLLIIGNNNSIFLNKSNNSFKRNKLIGIGEDKELLISN
jgi:hypothetical protein